MCKILLAILLSVFSVFSIAQAASREHPAYRQVIVDSEVPAMNGFIISFPVNEQQCRAAYGKRWQEKCAIALGMPGTVEKNIAITPAISGDWHWQNTNTLKFEPDNPAAIKPDTLYTFDLAKLFVPVAAKIDASKLAYTSPPAAVSLLASDFLVNPDPSKNHYLTAVFSFNYPVVGDFQPALSVTGNIQHGKPEMTWSAERNRLNISWPILKLSKQLAQAQINLPGFAKMEEKDGMIRYNGKNQNKGCTFLKNLPSDSDIFKIRKAELKKSANANLDNEIILKIETTLLTDPAQVLDHLTVWELPEKNSQAALNNYDWVNAPSIDAQVLQKSEKVNPVLQEKGKAATTNFSFTLNARPGRHILLRVDPKILSAAGKNLQKPFFSILKVPSDGADLGILQPGNILSLHGKGDIAIYSTNLPKINWKLEKIREPFLALLASNMPEPFKNNADTPFLAFESISIIKDGEIVLTPSESGKAQFSSLPLGKLLETFPDYLMGPVRLTLSGKSQNGEFLETSRLIVPTNLSIIAKKTRNGLLQCYVAEIATGNPADNVKVELLGCNGLVVSSAVTNSSGNAEVKFFSDLKRDKRPVALLAKRGRDLAWLPLEDRSRQVQYSNFTIAGNHVSDKDINVYAFSDRGVYRPGEVVNCGIISRTGDLSLLPADLPLFAEVCDPRGVRLWEKNFLGGENGFSAVKWQSQPTAASGKYFLNVRQAKDGELLTAVPFRIENFLPEALKMKIELPEIKGWLQLKNISPALQISLQNLYGTPAAGNKLKVELQPTPAKFQFSQYPDYIFTDAAPFLGESSKFGLPDAFTDKNGIAEMEIPFQSLAKVSSNLLILGEGFEADGGRAATAHAILPISPMEKIVGYAFADNLANPDFIMQGSKASLKFIVLDSDLQPASWENVSFILQKRLYATSLVSDAAGSYRYDDVPLNEAVQIIKQDIPATGCSFDLNTVLPGEYILMLQDQNGNLLSQFDYKVVGNSLQLPNEILAGSKMRLTLDKSHYRAGEKILASLVLPFDATGLITIEREGVENYAWFSAKAGSSLQEIEIPEHFEGKGYVTITAGRQPDSQAIYMQPMVSATAPFAVNVDRRNYDLTIDAPKEARPGSVLDLKITADRPGNILIYAVDEGILLLDNHPVPNPLAALMENRALDVQTLQTLDLLMPEESRITSRVSRFGGGMSALSFGNRFQNPFKRRSEPPLAFWSDIQKYADEPIKITIPVPDYYLGNLRIVAVGVGENQCGRTTADIKIGSPLIVKYNFPMTVAPGDHFEGTFILENNSESAWTGNLNMRLPDSLELVENLTPQFTVKPNNRIILPIKLKALPSLGACEIRFEAETPAGSIKRAISMTVRPPASYRYSVAAGKISNDAEIKAPRQLYAQNAKNSFMAATTPFPLRNAYGTYLETYLHGCSEQLISRAFGLFLLNLPEKAKQENKLRASVMAALRERTNYDGLSAWQGSEPDFLLTIYALDYLLSLAEKGYAIPQDLQEMLASGVEGQCSLNEPSLNAARKCAYGIWVLTRAGIITTRLLENLENSMTDWGIAWKNDLTALLLSASKKEMRIGVPAPMIPVFTHESGLLDEFAQNALCFSLFARYFPDALNESILNDFFEAVMTNLNNNAFATFSSLQGLRALSALDGQETESNINIFCREENADALIPLDDIGEHSICKAYIVNNVTSPVFWQLIQEGYDRVLSAGRDGNGLKIEKKLLDGTGKPVTRIHKGDILTISVNIASADDKVRECVISDLLPGGVEMIFPAAASERILREKCENLDRQEDRMLIFAKLDQNGKTFEWKVRGVNNGEFAVPPAYVEDMQNRAAFATSESGKLVIVSE